MPSIRKIGVIGRTYRHLNRYRRILAVLIKYGYGDLVDHLKIDQYIEVGLQLITRSKGDRIERYSRGKRLRLALEELGPTFIKLGQILSTRPDLIPVELIRELAKLQDKVPSFAFEDVQRILKSELGRPPEEVFAHFEAVPLASASIGQVHRAELLDGEAVAVKVQRPGIRKIIEVDLEIMLHLATLMERHVDELSLHRPVKIVEEFARSLENEIDYTSEAASMERVAAEFLDDATLYIPKVFQEACSRRVLTCEFVEGIKISELDKLTAAGLDRRRITRRGAGIYLKQIFEHGFFHADPHPGNIFVLPGDVICLFDFGMTGSVDRRTREDFVDLVDSVAQRDAGRTTRVLLDLTVWEEEPDERRLERDVAEFTGRHLYKPLGDIEIARVLQEMLELAARHRMRIPPDIFLMMKALSTIEGVARMLDPEFQMVTFAAPYINRAKLARYKPQRMAGDLMHFTDELLRFINQFPRDLAEITRQLKEQRLNLRVEHQGLNRILATQDQTSNRMAFAVVIAALIIGSALIVIAETPPLFHGISLIGIIGFFAAAIMGLWLLFAIIRRGRL